MYKVNLEEDTIDVFSSDNYHISILMPLTFHIAHLNHHTREISGVPLKLTCCHWFGVYGLPKSGNPDLCPQKKDILSFFL